MNSKYFDITSGRTDLHLKCTLLHEMCHSAADIKYGTIEENEGEDAETLGYINKHIVRYLKKIDCYDQIYYHGKKFMSVVKEVSKRAKLHVGDVYGYGREIDLLAYRARENITLNSLDKKRPLIKFRVNDVIRYIVNYINDYNNLYKNEGIIFGAAKSDNRGIISVTSTVMNKRYMIEKSDWHDVKIFALRGDDAEHCKLCAVVDTYSYDKVKDIADSIIRYIIRDV